MAELIFEDIKKVFVDEKKGEFVAVRDSNFEIKDKEFVVFVGPSGCGKTTSLRMIAGLEKQTEGNIYIDGQLVNKLHPKDRNIAMVFQDYALYPHMTVKENLEFGLKNIKLPKQEIEEKVSYAARILQLEELLDRKPKELSGGQRQRVAVGRAIVRSPKIFLFDEPLSNLDAKLRVQMRMELSKLHKELETTMVYVTHDQVEAMTLGDRIVVMNEGVIQQIADPETLYKEPANTFVASFIGSPPMNLIESKLVDEETLIIGEQEELILKIPSQLKAKYKAYVGKEVVFGIRPEHLLLDDDTQEEMNTCEFQVEFAEFLGAESLIFIKINNQLVTGKSVSDNIVNTNRKHRIRFNLDKMHLFDKETGLVIK